MSVVPLLRARVAPLFSPEGMRPYDPCHDAFHVERVARNAALLARLEGADAEVCEAAAWLHDLDRAGSKEPLAEARAHLMAVGASEVFAARVMEAVERHKDKSFAPGGKRPMSLEAQVLGDADKLEAIGAVGIARAFSFGGLKGRALWDGAPGVPEAERRALIEALAARAPAVYHSGKSGTTVDHFFEKLLRLKGDFATTAGRRMAEERHAFLVEFLGHFFGEWFAAAESSGAGDGRLA